MPMLEKWLAVTLMLLPVVVGEMKVVDLTWSVSSSTVYWPGLPLFNFSILYRQQFPKYWLEMNWFSTAEHGGTHMDCPGHLWKGGWRCHQIPPGRLIGPGVVINVTSKVTTNPDYRVTQSDLEEYEKVHGRIPNGAVVIMNSGWASRYPNKTLVFNTDTPNNSSTFHFPGFHENAVSWLIANRNIHMVGVDTPSTDYGQSPDFKVHVVLGQNNIPGLENVANVDKIPVKGATVFSGGMKLFDGSGGPARILATYNSNPTSGTGRAVGSLALCTCLFITLISYLFCC